MLVARPEGAYFSIVDAFAKSVRLGPDLERNETLSKPAIDRTIRALQVCAAKLKKLDVPHMRLVATEACRRARNGHVLIERARSQTGLKLELIQPEEEARLAVVSCAPLVSQGTDQILIFDIGGGSTELVWIDVSDTSPEDRQDAVARLRMSREIGAEAGAARLVDFVSVPLGVATLNERFADVEDESARFALMSWFFEEQLQGFLPYQRFDIVDDTARFQMIGTSGTVTTIAAAHLNLRRYDRRKVDGTSMSTEQIEAVVNRLMMQGHDGRIKNPAIGRDRAKLIMSGAAILQTLLRIWPTERLRVADRGLREGILYSMMRERAAFGAEKADG